MEESTLLPCFTWYQCGISVVLPTPCRIHSLQQGYLSLWLVQGGLDLSQHDTVTTHKASTKH